jgi:hypothetical protein
VILEPCAWQDEPFDGHRLGDFEALPRDGKPITTWRNRQTAFFEVAEGIRRCTDEIRKSKEDQEEDYRATLEGALASALPAKLLAEQTSLEGVQRALQLREINRFIDRDSALMPKIKAFLDDMDHGRLTKPSRLLAQYGTAERAYFSQEFSALREIGRHYERLGVLVKYGYIDLNAIFNVIVFPDDFWERTSEFRSVFQRDWWGNHGLPDFWENFNFLRVQYQRLRGGRDRESSPAEGPEGGSK